MRDVKYWHERLKYYQKCAVENPEIDYDLTILLVTARLSEALENESILLNHDSLTVSSRHTITEKLNNAIQLAER